MILFIMIIVILLTAAIERAEASPYPKRFLTDGVSTILPIASNTTAFNGVCPPFPDNCPSAPGCAAFDANFCPKCNCGDDFTTTTARFSGCQAQQCLLDCGNPPRYKKDHHGCDICLCDFGVQPPLPTTLTTNYERNSPTPTLYNTAASTTTTLSANTTTTVFDGLCPPFPDNCPSAPGCAAFDANFCPKCNCGADFTTTTARFSGCQAQQCLLDCGNPPRYKKDQHECDVCLCDFGVQSPFHTTLTTNYEKQLPTHTLYNTTALTTTPPIVIKTTTAIHGICPPFQDNCPLAPGCATFDANFCPKCNCRADFQSTTARFSGCQTQQCPLDCGDPPRYKKDQHGCDVCLCDHSG